MATDTIPVKRLNRAFRRSEQQVSANLLKFKTIVKNAYYGKVPDGGKWPLGSGTQIKGNRLGRVTVPEGRGFEPVEDELCDSNAGTLKNDEIISNGNSSFFYSLVHRDMRTDWIDLSILRFRPDRMEEIAHLEEGLQFATRYVHEEFRRSRYHLFCRNKRMGILPLDGSNNVRETYNSANGVDVINQAYVWEHRANGEMDENYIRVRFDISANHANFNQISELTLDMLDDAHVRLSYNAQAFLDGTGLYDVVLADGTMSNRMAELEAEKIGTSQANVGGYNLVDLSKAYGTERVMRDRFSTRTDVFAARFFPDVDFNEAMLAADGYAFNDNDSRTWPRFKRVYPFVTVKSKGSGVESVENPDYLKAPFGLSTILVQSVMEVQSVPETTSVGGASATGRVANDGTATWMNYKTDRNPRGFKGYWLLDFEIAAKQNYDDRGFSFFHRIGRKVQLSGVIADLPTATPRNPASPYCFRNLVGNSDLGVGSNEAVASEYDDE